MEANRWQQVKRLLDAALDLDADERERFLAEACRDDAPLRAEVESLLGMQAQAREFLESPVSAAAAQLFTQGKAPVNGPTRSETETDTLVGRVLGDFTIIEKLGEGGCGAVYRAEQITLARAAAIKVIHSRHRGEREMIERFLREARLASRLEHPYNAHIYAFGAEDDGLWWIAMEYIRGTPLNELLRVQGALPLARCLPLLERICDVVHTAHEQGILHRDIKPANVMVIERAGKLLPKLLDFGIAKSLDATFTLPADEGELADDGEGIKTVGIIGSPTYMAPELWERNAAVSTSADIYALGVLAYEALTGHAPFTGTRYALAYAHACQPPPSLGERFPRALDAVIARAMAKAPEDRYGTALEFFADLRAAAGDRQLSRERAPYIGLHSFTADDAEIFFGRNRETAAFIDKLFVHPFMAVIGPSGAGKSSFVQAGVLPNLPVRWRAITLRPGSAPLTALTARLAREHIDTDDLGAAARMRQCTLVLVIDQFEELFTLCQDENERRQFANRLQRAARTPEDPVRVIITLRDDFLMRAERLFGDMLAQGMQLLNTPARDDLMSILTEPARRAGFAFEDDSFAAEIVDAVAEQQGALPLLAFTSARLWELRDEERRQLRRGAYAEMGGVGGALAQHAEAMMAAMTRAEQRLVREAFRHLVTSEGTRAVLTRAELIQVLGDNADNVIEKMIAARLLTASEGDSEIERIEIIHEALLSSWPRLMGWRREDAEGARLRDQLRTAARQWHERGRPRGLLWRDEALTEYQLWRAHYAGRLTELEEAFGEHSLAEVMRIRRARRLLISALFVLLTAAAAVFYGQRQQTREQLLDFYEEQGRQELLAGNSTRALVYFNEVYREGRNSAPLRLMLAQALQPLDAQLATIGGHTFYGNIAIYSPDGKYILTSTRDSTIKLWDATDYRLLNTFAISHNLTGGPAFSPDSLTFALPCEDGSVRIFDVMSGRLLNTMAHHNAQLYSVEFSHDGKFLVTASADFTARIWQVADGKLLMVITGHKDQLRYGSFSPDGTRVITASDDRTAKVWEAATGKLLLSLEGHNNFVIHARFSPDGRKIITTSSDRVAKLWDADTGRFLLSFEGHTGIIVNAACSPDGKRIVTASGDKTAKLWNATTGQLLTTLAGHEGYINSVQFSRDGQFILTASEDMTARIWQARAGNIIFSLESHTDWVRFAQFSPDGQRIVTASSDRTAKVWATQSGQLLLTLTGHQALIHSAVFSSDGKRIVTASEDKTAKIWDAQSGQLLITLAGHNEDVAYAEFSPDGQRVLTASIDRTARVWDAASGQTRQTLGPQRTGLLFASFSPDGRYIATTNFEFHALIWDTVNGTELRTIKGHNGMIFSAIFSPDGQRIVTAGKDGTAKLWEVASGNLQFSFEGHSSDVAYAAFSPDGSFVVTTSFDNSAKIWDVDSGRLLLTIAGHSFYVVAAAFSPDGQRLVTASLDKTAKVWDVHLETRSPQEIDRLVKERVNYRIEQGRLVNR